MDGNSEKKHQEILFYLIFTLIFIIAIPIIVTYAGASFVAAALGLDAVLVTITGIIILCYRIKHKVHFPIPILVLSTIIMIMGIMEIIKTISSIIQQ